jgi:hypothetical protein
VPKFLDVSDEGAARDRLDVPGLGEDTNVFTGKVEYNWFPFSNVFDTQLFIASLAQSPEVGTQSMYAIHRVTGDMHKEIPISSTHDAVAAEIYATEAYNGGNLCAFESSCVAEGPDTEIDQLISGVFNGRVITYDPARPTTGTIGNMIMIFVDQVPPVPAGLTVDAAYSLIVKPQIVGDENYSLYVEGGDSVVAGRILPMTPNAFALRIAARADTNPEQGLLRVEGPEGQFVFQVTAYGEGYIGGEVADSTWAVNNLRHPGNIALHVRQAGDQTADPFRVSRSSGAVLFGVDSNGGTTISNDITLPKTGQTRIYNNQLGTDSIKLGGAGGIELETFQSGSYGTRAKLTAAGNLGIGTTEPAALLHVAGNALVQTLDVANADTTLSRLSAGVVAVEGVELVRRTISTITGAASISTTTGDQIVLIDTGGLPTLGTAVGARCVIKLKNRTNASVLIATTSAQTIEGLSNYTLPAGQSITVVSDSTNNWSIV